MPTWKKVVVSGSGLSQLANDANYLIDAQTGAILTGSFTGSFVGDGSGLTGIATTLGLGSDANTGSLDLKTQSLTIQGKSGVLTSVVGDTVEVDASDLSGSAHLQRLAIQAAGEAYTDTAVDTLSGSVGSLLNPLDNRVDALETFSSSLDAAFATDAEVASAVDTLSGSAHIQRDALATSLSSDISSEESARIAADTTLQGNIDSEASTRAAADTTLQGNIDSEESARIAADNTLQGNIDSEETARIAADNTLQGNIDSLSGSAHIQREALVAGLDSDLSALSGSAHSQRVAIESSLDGKIGTEKGRIDAILSASVADTDTFAEIVTLINSVDTENDTAFAGFVTSSNARATNIEASVTSLSSSAAVANANLSSDLTDAYVAADSALSSSAHIAREALKTAQSTAYIAADTALSSSAHTQRLAIESGLSSDISTLETNTTAALNASSSALQGNIDSEESARIAADNTLQSNIDSEESARIAADNTLQGNIDSLESSARAELNASSSTLQGNIDSEETARIAADNTLQSNIDSLSGSAHTQRLAIESGLTSDFQAADTALSSSAHDQRVALAAAQSTAYIAADTALSSSTAAALSIEQGRIDAILTGSQADKDSFAEIVTLINSVDTENDQAFAGFVTSSNARATAIETSVTNLSSSAATANANLSSDLTSAYQTADTALSSSAHTQRLAIESGLTSDISSLSGSAHAQRVALDNSIASEQAVQDGRLDSLESFTASLDDTYATEAELNAATASVKTYADNAVDTLSGSAHIQRDALATSLASDISDEASARVAADNTLQGNIDSLETAARAELNASSSTLQGNIDSEASSRAAADTTLQGNIDSEAATRLANDNTLQSNITSLSGSAHTQRVALASAQSSAYIAADTALSSSAHTQRAAIETSLDGKITTEKGRIDAILSASTADADTFAEIVTLVNSVDTANDTAFAGYVLSNDNRSTAIEGSVTSLSSSAALANVNLATDLTTAYQAADTTLQGNINALSSSSATAIRAEYVAADSALSASIATTLSGLSQTLTVNGDTGTDGIDLKNEDLNIEGDGGGITTSVDAATNTISLVSNGLVSSSAQTVANLVGQDVVADSFTGDGSGLTGLTVAQSATVISTFSNQTSVAVTHNFESKNVLATVYEGDTQIIPASVTTTDNNVVTVTFDSPTTGRIIVGKGGHIVSGSIPFSNLLSVPTLVSGSEQVDLVDTVGFTAYSASVEAKIDALDGTFATDADVTALSSSAHTQRVAIETALAGDISTNAADITSLSGSAHTQRVAIETSLQSNIDGAISTANSELNASSSALTTAYTAADSALSSSIATTISNLSSTISISGSTGNSDVNLVTDDLSIVGVAGQTETTVSGTSVSVGFVTNPTVSGNLTVTGDLTVTGNTFEAQVTNLNVEDRFILLNSGSNTGDAGIIFGGSDGTANVGSGIFFDNPAGVFGFSQGIGSADTSATHQSKLGNIEVSAGAPTGAPLFQGVGTIHVDSSTGDVLIYV